MGTSEQFPLFRRAEKYGVFEGKGALIVAPAATGKSYIGREFIRSVLRKGVAGPNVYLVPFRALAGEVFETYLREQKEKGDEYTIRIATGEHTDPFVPEQTDILIATYERFASLRQATGFPVGSIVADELHLLADETRGPFVESLIARMKASGKLKRFLGLSAVVENGEQIAAWLGTDLISGSDKDRKVPVEFECQTVRDKKKALLEPIPIS